MTCTTGNCPDCIVRVGGTITPWDLGDGVMDGAQTYHLFIWYHDNGADYIYRGGPQRNSSYAGLTASGAAQEYSAPTRETRDIDWPFGNLVTNRMVGIDRDRDYQTWVARGSRASEMIIVGQGPDYCGLDPQFTLQTRRIGELGRTYNAVAADRTDNSNATVYTILHEMGLPTTKPAIIAPGWGTNLHTTLRAHERPSVLDQIREQLDWFNRLDPIEQMRVLQRGFGGTRDFGGP